MRDDNKERAGKIKLRTFKVVQTYIKIDVCAIKNKKIDRLIVMGAV